MNGRTGLISMLAAGGLMLASQQASAVVVVQDDVMADAGGLFFNQTDLFDFGGAYAFQGAADSDGNTFGVLGQQLEFNGAGFSHSIPIADVTAALGAPLSDGVTLRMSSWVMSNPLKPWAALGTDGYKMEFWNMPLGDFNLDPLGRTNDTEVGFGLPGLSPAAQSLTTTGWQQTSFTVEISDALVDFASLQEIRPVLFEGDFSGSNPGSAGGEMFVDGFAFEVFPNLAAANATALPANAPGGFDLPGPPDLSGDANGDGFVGIADLNIVLGNWNAGTPPAPPIAPGPDVISDFSNFNLDGTYVDWASGTFTSDATAFTVQTATNSGGGWHTLAAPLDATGETTLEVQLDVNAANVSSAFNVVLIDADGTERVFRFDNLVVGANQTLTVDLIDFLGDNAAGAVEGLDLSALTTFHIQGTFDPTHAGVMDLTFDNLALIPGGLINLVGDINGDGFVGIADLNVVLGTWNNGTPPAPAAGATIPEPASVALLGLGGLAMLRRRSA